MSKLKVTAFSKVGSRSMRRPGLSTSRPGTRPVVALLAGCLLACSNGGSGAGTGTGQGGDNVRSGSGGSGQAGGESSRGGSVSVGGNAGGATSTGGVPATGGGSSATGASAGSGGRMGSGGVAAGGRAGAGGSALGTGGGAGRTGAGGNAVEGQGGSTGGTGGNLPDAASTARDASDGGLSGSGGAGGVAGGTGPCDIYASGNTPCVAAHSTVRALYAAYKGKLYQVRRASDNSTKDVPVLATGDYADASVQDTFCAGTTCTISVIYDQSPNRNDLTKSPPGGWLKNGGLEADATKAKIKLNGHTVYGVYTTMNWDDSVGAVGYRNNSSKGVPIGDEAEAMYMVVSGKHYNQWCCFDYGNAETNNLDNGKATMEAVYFGNSTQWGKGSGTGPWVMADLEDGVFAGGSTAAAPTNTSLIADYVTAMLKGPSGNRFVLKGGDAQAGTLATKYDGARPAGYSPQKKEGAIILGTGGDNSHTGEGTFFEGCMTKGMPSDATDDAIQANIVAAGYGR
jgi:hypothetical protein